ncbi:MAG: LamG domain-containing protein [Planctomycetes bacterium]|nr:LamG domain-containing protein [Planctomycetota bacterium]
MFGAGFTKWSVRGVLAVLLVSFGARPSRAELLLFYSFDDDSDPLLAVDESGQGNDGVISGNDLDGDGLPETPALYTEPGLGRSGAPNDRALDFLTTADGTYVTVPSAAAGAFDSMTGNDAATVAMWIQGAENQPVDQWNFYFGPNRQLGSHIPWSNGNIYFDVAGCCGPTQRLQQNEPDSSKYKGDWNHYAFVKEQDVTRIYQNGTLWAEGAGKAPLGTITEIFLGAGPPADRRSYNGLIDDIGVWDEALPEEEIQNFMENGAGPPRPISLRRDIPDTLINGTSGVVTIKILPRIPGAAVSINEKMPAGLAASNPSHNGALAGDTITWSFPQVDVEINLTYTMTAAPDAMDAKIPSTATVNGVAVGIGGDTTYTGSLFTAQGFLRLWNHLGPLAFNAPARAGDHGPPGACDANGGADLPKDWIVNEEGSVTELDVMPFPGRLIRPAYGGDGAGSGARAAGLVIAGGDTGAVVTNRFPVWKAGFTRGDTIDHASAAVHGFDAEDHLTLSSVYVTNTGGPIDTNLGIGSDDAIQIFLNDVDLTVGGIIVCRPWGAANEEQDVVPVTLPPGESRLLVKVTDGCCGSGFRLRFQNPADPLGPGLLPPAISLSLVSATSPVPASVVRDIAPASYNLGDKVDVSLAVTASPAANVRVREVLPEGASAEPISDGGALAGGVVQWDLTAVTARTVTYKLVPAPCAAASTFGQSTWQVGSVEALVTGEPSVSRNPFADQPLGPWQSVDIGPAAGAAVPFADHEVVVSAAGGGTRSKREDQVRFIHLPATGDFEISARIDCMDDPGLLGQAGLMVRDTLDPHAAHVYFALTAGDVSKGGPRFLFGGYRRQTDPTKLSATFNISDKNVDGLPIYLKLKRAGTKITAERSADGTQYAEVGSREIGTGTIQVNLRDQTLVGLAVSGGGGGVTGVTFRAVSGLPFTGVPEDCATAGDEDQDGKADCADEDCAALPECQPKGGFHRGDADNNGQLQLTDAIRILGFLFLGGVPPTCLDAGDADDNGVLQLTDAIRILGFLFLGGVPPEAPGPPPNACGSDAGGELGCVEYTSC